MHFLKKRTKAKSKVEGGVFLFLGSTFTGQILFVTLLNFANSGTFKEEELHSVASNA